MNVINTTLIAIETMLVVVLLAVPLFVAVKGLGLWQDLPKEVYHRQRQQLWHLRPVYFWVASAILMQTGNLFGWLRWSNAQRYAEGASLAVLAVVLVSHLAWAWRTVRSGRDADTRLRQFAQYAGWGSAAGILILTACVVGYVLA